MNYPTGSAKQDPETKAVAVRTIFPDISDFADRQWGVMTVNNGGHYATNEMVENWPDIQPIPGWTAPAPAALEEIVSVVVPQADNVENPSAPSDSEG